MGNQPRNTSPLRRFAAEFAENRIAVVALGVVAIIVLLAVFAPLVSPQDPYDLRALVLRDARRPPGYVGAGGYVHLLGTDAQGRDLLSAIFYGLRISLLMGLVGGGLAMMAGMLIGLLAAGAGPRVEALLMRLVDLQLSFPAVLMAFVIAAVLGQGKPQLVVALAMAQYAYFARAAHSAAVAERGKDYVMAARAVPLRGRTVLLRHLLPNIMPPLIVVSTLQIASAISLEATLSFLGVGLPATEPSLGTLIANGFQYMLSGRYWISIFPGVALVLLIVAINVVGDRLRDQLNPRLRR